MNSSKEQTGKEGNNSAFNIGSQNANKIINVGNEDRIKELEQQVSDLETALVITKNSRKSHIENENKLQQRIAELEARIDGLVILKDHLEAKSLALLKSGFELEAELKRKDEALGWISIDDRLPDESGPVLGVMKKTQDQYICWYKPDRKLFLVYGAGVDPISDMKVTHWKRLPKPPMDVCREYECKNMAEVEQFIDNGYWVCRPCYEKINNPNLEIAEQALKPKDT